MWQVLAGPAAETDTAVSLSLAVAGTGRTCCRWCASSYSRPPTGEAWRGAVLTWRGGGCLDLGGLPDPLAASCYRNPPGPLLLPDPLASGSTPWPPLLPRAPVLLLRCSLQPLLVLLLAPCAALSTAPHVLPLLYCYCCYMKCCYGRPCCQHRATCAARSTVQQHAQASARSSRPLHSPARDGSWLAMAHGSWLAAVELSPGSR